jgi:two-component system chemotaxis response regulator CheB
LAVPNLSVATDKILLLGASTGGIDALTTILSAFPANCPPTAIVQHTGRNFSETLVRLLNNRCAAEVVMAQTGVAMQGASL